MIFLEADIKKIADSLIDIHHLMKNKKIFIAGGLGFLGKYFASTVSYLNRNLDANITLYLADNYITSNSSTTRKFISTLNDNLIHIKEIDVINFRDFLELDLVINCAGLASPYYYRKYPLETINVSITGTMNLLELARKNKAKFSFFSSSEIYGNPDIENIPTNEIYNGNVSPIGPRSCYDESKRLGETLCYTYKDKFDLHTNIIRPFNVYGPGMSKFDYRVLPNFMNNILEGSPLNIYSNGKQTRTYCYITDAIEGFFRVFFLGKYGEAYNIGNPTPEISVIELKDYLEEALSKKIEFNLAEYPDTYPSDEPLRRCPDINKAIDHIGYHPKIYLDEGLKNFYNWAKVYFPLESN